MSKVVRLNDRVFDRVSKLIECELKSYPEDKAELMKDIVSENYVIELAVTEYLKNIHNVKY